MPKTFFLFILSFFAIQGTFAAQVKVGADRIMQPMYISLLQGKKIGLITNHTAINAQMESTINLFKTQSKKGFFKLNALFAPEHGLTGSIYAGEGVQDGNDEDGIPVYSLFGKTRRPSAHMLKGIDLIVYDIQDIGSRSYTYISTLFYAMEECAKLKIPFVVLDRPNPINGLTVDGPMIESAYRSFLGYINIPYCHGMTVGELALLFNAEYKIGCQLTVVPMSGWSRKMSFQQTGLPWIPTSPYIPEATTAFYYPTTGVLGELSLVNIGVGFTLPFKLVGAPWIDAKKFTKALNAQKFPGVYFEPFHYTPFYGKYAKQNCQGTLIFVTDPLRYKPFATAYLLFGILKSLYPQEFNAAIKETNKHKEHFFKFLGDPKIFNILLNEQHIVWKLWNIHEAEHQAFKDLRKLYLIKDYSLILS